MADILLDMFDDINKLYTNFKKTSTTRYTLSYLETRKELLEQYWTSYSNEHHAILKIEKTTEGKKPIKDIFSKAQDVYLEFKTTLKEEILLKSSPAAVSPHVSSSVISKPKLPPINLPSFSGNYRDWLNFKDLFTSLIHQDQGLSDIQKHHYLRSTLKGEAEQLLRHFDVTAANYKKAWETLINRYSNKRIIVNNILNRLLNQKKLTVECPKGLKELLDITNECINSLNNLDIDTKSWDPIIVHIIVSKLDLETHKAWEQSLGASMDLPTFNQITTFIEGRFRAIEMVQATQKKDRKDVTLPQITQKSKPIKSFAAETNTECTYCNKNHYICHCTDFTTLTIDQRREFAKENNLCFNCLVKGHSIRNCRQRTSCRTCNYKHHTLLHNEAIISKAAIADASDSENESEPTEITSMKVFTPEKQVLLATAQVGIKNRNGVLVHLRALVDQGSQATFITESAVQFLNLKKTPLEANITGISNHAVKSRFVVHFDVYSPLDSTWVSKVSAHVLTKLTPLLPSKELDVSQWPGLTTIKLSDAHMHKPGPIDLLLGADIYAEILLEGLKKSGSLIAQNSKLGWLVSGTTNAQAESSTHTIMVSSTLVEVDQLLRKFWESEEYLPHEKPLTLLEIQCEEHYVKTHTRTGEGRYVVRLPFKDSHEDRLGDSRKLAYKRLLQMEKRFSHKLEFQKKYNEFMDEYQRLNHMEDVDTQEKTLHKMYYLPHHAVINESSATTKFRVVFDGSAKPETGSALNDELLIGQALQQDLRDLIIRWRTHKICLIGDIKQMYRQILVSKDDADYQRILWRPSPQEDIKEKRLLTVTYGTSCAPFLAIRTLKQLAQDEKYSYPNCFDIIHNDFYMDDLLTGANDEETAVYLQKQITEVLAKGKFQMHKWASNSSVVLAQIPNSEKVTKECIDITVENTVKALGIKWNSRLDIFQLHLDVSAQVKPFTKTTVLSDIARNFDPLGFLSPIIITAKIFLQKLWLCGVGWTDELPSELASEWESYRNELVHMDTLYLERWMYTQFDGTEKMEVHGFSDASCKAYAAVVYIRVITSNKIYVSLVLGKSKVAPVKQVSLPRLELCGAVLLTKIIKDVKTSLNVSNDSVFAYTDSTIVLSWLRKSPNNWKTYVANRTTEILNVLSSDRWHHIKSTDNPADCATRGLSPESLKSCDLWWHGPHCLQQSVEIPSSLTNIPETALESKSKTPIAALVNVDNEANSILTKFSKFQKLVRVTAYLFRFITICKNRLKCNIDNTDIASIPQYLTVDELAHATNICIRLSQETCFSDEIQMLKTGCKLPKSSKLRSLTPFLDDDQILRATGRLHNAQVEFDVKSPIILSSKCNLALLIVRDTHLKTLHGGPQLTHFTVRHKYWIIGAKNLVRKTIRQCMTCFKYSASPINQLMGQLPACRVNPTKPFRNSGVDYAGPVTLKLYPGRCQRTTKAYICLFVCTVTKAIHLELVSDLSTAAFISAFRRFTSRRGHCSDIWSDCATNFVGASKELDIVFKNRESSVIGEISELLAKDKTKWHFIPPGSPHFGGLWEAGVKSVKSHIKRVVGQSYLTFEEYSTLLTQVEACVNSRPLSPMGASIDDIPPLTPGHFLIGEAPVTVPEVSLNDQISRLDRWQLIQRMVQNIWARWSTEYLTTLQNRFKWHHQAPEPDVGAIVLVKDERLPPGKWLLGRIVEKHSSKDGLTRVVTLKYKNSVFKRPITKLCPLPFEN